MKIYGDKHSGNCIKVELTCKLLGMAPEWVHVDILAGATQAPDFLKKNPNGKIPVLELDDGRCLSESNAIINYLAHGSALLPEDPFELAKVQQWQCFEQYSHEPYIAVARYIAKYLEMPEERLEEYEAKQEGGHKALEIMNQHLAHSPFMVGDNLTTADISLYGYTHVAEEGGFCLKAYPFVSRWLYRVAAIEMESDALQAAL